MLKFDKHLITRTDNCTEKCFNSQNFCRE